MFTFLLVVLLGFPACGLLGLFVAGERGRLRLEGLLLGTFFGPLGVIIEALLPVQSKPPAPSRSTGEMSEYNDLPLVWNENRIDEADVDKIISG